MARRSRSDAGFTMIELLLVTAILVVVAGMAALAMPTVMPMLRADGGLARVVSEMRTARDLAISSRRNLRLDFTGNDEIRITRMELDNTTTLLRSVRLEDGMRFLLQAGVPDTPDAFGAANAVEFGPVVPVFFTSEGTLVDNAGNPVNGTIFVSRLGQPLTARAVTIFGPTAFVRGYRWNGSRWIE